MMNLKQSLNEHLNKILVFLFCTFIISFFVVFFSQKTFDFFSLPISLDIQIVQYEPVWPHDLTQEQKQTLTSIASLAYDRTQLNINYDPTYYDIDYPNGDVPGNVGVCTDVVIRTYRALGVDLQQLVHEDMKKNFHLYPDNWNLAQPDTNIDHRRVPNLMVFFERKGQSLSLDSDSKLYLPGDIIAWRLPDNRTHIGIVSSYRLSDQAKPLVIHNYGLGPKMNDMLFSYKIIGHYRFLPDISS